MSHDREATREAPRTGMLTLPSTFMNQLLVQVDPHRRLPAPNEASRSAQIICSRWLALRRLRVLLAIQQLAAMTHLSVEIISLLESGLANAAMLSNDARRLLATYLAPAREDIKLTADIIALALGQDEARIDLIMARVIADLEALDGVEEHKTVSTAAVSTQPDPVIERQFELLHAAPTMFDVLCILNAGANYASAIFQAIQRLPKRSRDKQAKHNTQFGSMLHQMIDQELIVKSEQKLLPNMPGRPLQYYTITEAGRRTFNLERTRRMSVERKLIEALQQENEDPNPIYTNPLPNS